MEDFRETLLPRGSKVKAPAAVPQFWRGISETGG
jgi:hypothetical protein